MSAHTTTSLQDGVLTLTLNRPEKLNAFTPQMNEEMADAFDAASENDDVRVIIVTGAGRGFCAGADISAGAGAFGKDAGETFGGDRGPRAGGRFVEAIFNCKKPSIAAINGPAAGVGITMTLPMDIRLIADTAKVGFVFTRRGLVPEAACAWFLPKLVGLPQALRWCLSGAPFDAQEALRGGLVAEVLAPEKLLARAHEIAREIVENTSPIATAITRQLFWRVDRFDTPGPVLEIDGGFNALLGQGADVAEGVAAFIEKRQPHFTGSAQTGMPSGYPWWTPE